MSLRESVAASLTRPFRVTLPMVILVALVPFYIYIGELMPDRTLHMPALALDRAIPLQPVWGIVYGVLYLFLILVPLFVVRDDAQIQRTLFAYLTVWITAYIFFFAYPTMAPRPAKVLGDGFAVSGLRFLYDSDPPYNCFPSLHVAHSFVSAIACLRVSRRIGMISLVFATLVGVSTLFTKQHYIVDVIAGALLAFVACAIFLRKSASRNAM